MATFRDGLLAGKTAFVAGASSGINLQIATRLAQAGAAVTVLSRSPEKIEAAAAGIREEDVVIAVEDRRVGSSEELVVAVDAFDPGDTVTVEVVRGGGSVQVEATLDAA